MLAHANRFGLAFGLFLAFWHLAWSVMVATGTAQPFMDWVLDLHMIQPFYIIKDFDISKALFLVVFTFVMGYIFGGVLGMFWKFACMSCSTKGKK